MRSAARLLLATALVLLAAAPAARADFVGSNAQNMITNLVIPPSGWDSYISRMSSDGLKIARLDASWGATEVNPPANGVHSYDWSYLDARVAAFAKRGIRVSAGLSFPPRWAAGSGTKIAQSHYPDFAAFSGAFAKRYGQNGTFWQGKPADQVFPIRDYEVWTEANSSLYWTGARADPADYLNALKQVSVQVRANDPGARVLASLGWQGSTDFVNGLYAAGMKGSIDGIAYHPYSPTAEGIVTLVRGLRDVMRANGDGDLPIDVTELGQPVSPAPGASSAGSGFVTDQARAATQSFAAEALGRSNCGVTDYLIFTLVASETNREAIGEGYMGIYSVKSPTPNATGVAMSDAQKRIDAGAKGVLKACGGSTADGDLMPLDVTFNHVSPRCMEVSTNYHGNPLEGATLVLSNSLGVFARLNTDAHGASGYCIPGDFVTPDFTAQVEVPNLARSGSVTCSITTTACDGPAPASTIATTPPAITIIKQTPVDACTPRLKLLIKKVRAKKTSLSGSLKLCPVKATRTRVTLYVVRKQKHSSKLSRKKQFVRRVSIKAGTTLKFNFTGKRLRRGEKLQLVKAADTRQKTPRLVSTATAYKKLGAKK